MDKIVQIYSKKVTPRLVYSLNLIFRTILKIDYLITHSPDPEKPLVNYSFDRSIGGVFIQPEKILFETGVRKQDVWVAHMGELPLFFQQPPEAGFPLDIFAFAFYNAARYEEYLPFTRDEHGRFAAEASLAYKHNFLNLPIVDIWAIKFGQTLSILFPTLKIPEPEFQSLLTVDVDQPFAYRSKGIIRNLGGLVIDVFKGRDFSLRFKCLTRKQRDPYDTFDFINSTAKENDCPVTYFFTAGKRSRYDLNPKPTQRCYKRLIKKSAAIHGTGIHPSYNSRKSIEILQKEMRVLERISRIKMEISRQHFLLLNFPDTYRRLIEVGIKRDFTLGFVREAGFRAGVARPFMFYDLEMEEETSLELVPFAYMEGTFHQYKRYSADQAREVIQNLVDITREVGGLFVSVWHNTSLTEKDGWEGWRDVFTFAMKAQKR
jgi:hypothetical protein